MIRGRGVMKMVEAIDQPKDPIRPTCTGTERPKPVGCLCKVCGVMVLNTVDADGRPAWDGVARVHEKCEGRQSRWSAGSGPKAIMPPGFDNELRQDLAYLIQVGIDSEARHRQTTIGPSELGGSCDRRLGMRLAGVEAVNHPDPWPAEVGTAVHARMEEFIALANKSMLNRGRFITEQRVAAADYLHGTSDLFDQKFHAVIDWKTAGTTRFREMRDRGAPEGYVIQVQLYGLGWARAGYRVDSVCLAVLPRAGYLKDMIFFQFPYQPEVAHKALARMQRVGQQVINLQVSHGSRDFWAEVPGADSHCGYCPYFCRGTRVASKYGCPGVTK